MKKQKISRAILQTLDTSDLINLAKSVELFVPPNFSRSSLIDELLSLGDRIENLSYNDLKMMPLMNEVDQLPISYSLTEIHLLLRDPMWCFVFWDINDVELDKILLNESQVHLFLRVMSFKAEEDEEAYAYVDIDVKKEERSCYVQTAIDDEFTQVALCYRTKTKIEVMARSNFIYLPRKDIKRHLSLEKEEVDDVISLSGLQHLKLWHFEHFKEIFKIG